MKEESSKAAQAFREYCELGPFRSLDKLRQKYGKSTAYIRQLERWSAEYSWVARAIAYDKEQAEERRRLRREEEEAQRQVRLVAVRAMLLRHVKAEVEPSAASQIQAGKLLYEHDVADNELAQMREELVQLQETIRALIHGNSSKGDTNTSS